MIGVQRSQGVPLGAPTPRKADPRNDPLEAARLATEMFEKEQKGAAGEDGDGEPAVELGLLSERKLRASVH